MLYWSKVRELGYSKAQVGDTISREMEGVRQRLLHVCSHFSTKSSKSEESGLSSMRRSASSGSMYGQGL